MFLSPEAKILRTGAPPVFPKNQRGRAHDWAAKASRFAATVERLDTRPLADDQHSAIMIYLSMSFLLAK
jgi:hypothetical protein